MINSTGICYLCGDPLEDEIDDDHVPPRHFFAKELRNTNSLNLLTIPAHRSCNKSYQLDEEYFVHTFAPLAMNTFTGKSILQELYMQYKQGRNIPLSRKVLSEFEARPSGLYLPKGKIAKRFDPNRVWRVVWKITRGLFFDEYKIFLPEVTARKYNILTADEKPPDEFFLLSDEPIHGRYPGVFAYKYIKFADINDFHFWVLIFWDKIITLIYFHDPRCDCKMCSKHDNGHEPN